MADKYAIGVLEEGSLLDAFDMSVVEKAFMNMGEDDPIYLGFEWEVDEDMLDKSDITYLAPDLTDYINFGEDIDGLAELRSIPATLEAHRQYMRDLFFAHGINRDFHTPRNSGSGLHIHIDKKTAFKGNGQALLNYIVFINSKFNKDFVDLIAGRSCREGESKRTQNNRGNIGYDAKGRPISYTECRKVPDSGHYICGFTGEKIVVDSDIKVVGDNMLIPGHTWRYAVTTRTDIGAHHDTIELRIGNSPNTEHELFRQLEFADALVRYCRDTKYPAQTVDAFVLWLLNGKQDTYPELMKSESVTEAIADLEERGIIKIEIDKAEPVAVETLDEVASGTIIKRVRKPIVVDKVLKKATKRRKAKAA